MSDKTPFDKGSHSLSTYFTNTNMFELLSTLDMKQFNLMIEQYILTNEIDNSLATSIIDDFNDHRQKLSAQIPIKSVPKNSALPKMSLAEYTKKYEQSLTSFKSNKTSLKSIIKKQ